MKTTNSTLYVYDLLAHIPGWHIRQVARCAAPETGRGSVSDESRFISFPARSTETFPTFANFALIDKWVGRAHCEESASLADVGHRVNIFWPPNRADTCSKQQTQPRGHPCTTKFRTLETRSANNNFKVTSKDCLDTRNLQDVSLDPIFSFSGGLLCFSHESKNTRH